MLTDAIEDNLKVIIERWNVLEFETMQITYHIECIEEEQKVIRAQSQAARNRLRVEDLATGGTKEHGNN